jgi:hypothetical protein
MQFGNHSRAWHALDEQGSCVAKEPDCSLKRSMPLRVNPVKGAGVSIAPLFVIASLIQPTADYGWALKATNCIIHCADGLTGAVAL